MTDRAFARSVELHVAETGPQELSLSAVVLGKESPLIAGTHGGENPFGLPGSLRAEGSSTIPDLSGIHRTSSDRQLVVYVIVQPGKSAVACRLEFISNGVPDLTLQQSLFDTAARPTPCLTDVGLDQLKVGKYERRVRARSESESVPVNPRPRAARP